MSQRTTAPKSDKSAGRKDAKMNKRNKIIIIMSIIFIVLAIAFLITGFALAGNDVLAWFCSKYAMLFYIAFGVYFLVIMYFVVTDRIKKI